MRRMIRRKSTCSFGATEMETLKDIWESVKNSHADNTEVPLSPEVLAKITRKKYAY